jgi:23S rRNA (adenine-N6)-dimethyltransferase
LVRSARIEPVDLVLDLGAGGGALTAPLVRSARRVIAVELDPGLAANLRRRFPSVDVICGDALEVALPPKPFKVVASLPFDGATAMLRRLLDPCDALKSADVIVDWELARKRAAVWPSTQLGTYWSAWFELSIERRLPRCVFAPPPSVDAALLRIVRRGRAFVPVEERRQYERFLQHGYRRGPRAVVPWRVLKRCEAELGFDRRATGRDLDARQWAALFRHAVRRPV